VQMNWLLFSTLTMLTFFVYIVNNRLILHPSVLVCGVFTASALFLSLNTNAWNYNISFETYAFIIVSIILFVIGVALGTKVRIKTRLSRRKKNFTINEKYRHIWAQLDSIDISRSVMGLLSLICLLVTIFYAYHQYQLSLSLGNSNGFFGIVGTIRSVVQTDNEAFQLGFMLNVGISLTRAIGYICIFIIVSKIILKKRSILKYFVPVICLIINTILATGRGGFITMIVACIFDLYIVRKIKGEKKFNQKMVRDAIIGAFVFAVAFRLLGTLTGKSLILSAWDTFSIYIGSSLLCLDSLLSGGWELSSYFGRHTFTGIYNILGTLGFSLPYISNHAEMVRWSHFSSNIYTAFYPYLLDFGVFVTLILQLIIGIIIGIVWRKFHHLNSNLLLLVTYGRFWGSALVYYSIAERLCSSYLALNIFAEIFFYIVILRFLVRYRDSSLPLTRLT
jgi:oligosaccharide repeat unit polymerase